MSTPAYYQFPTCQVADISLHLTPAASQAVQYLARSSRLDKQNKSNDLPGRLEDLRKAQDFIGMEIDRLTQIPEDSPAPVFDVGDIRIDDMEPVGSVYCRPGFLDLLKAAESGTLSDADIDPAHAAEDLRTVASILDMIQKESGR